ncbi:WD40 repeat domain-containing protein [Candidatus Babeliales bacterium]|nr:WD40 repeat domain-containing protein [Candidatus Babeliales bacterium]
MKKWLLSLLLSITTLSAIPTLEELVAQKLGASFRSKAEIEKFINKTDYFTNINETLTEPAQSKIASAIPKYLPIQREVFQGPIYWNSNNRFFVSIDNQAYLWQLIDGEYRSIFQLEAIRIIWNPTGTSFISIDRNLNITLWEISENVWRSTPTEIQANNMRYMLWNNQGNILILIDRNFSLTLYLLENSQFQIIPFHSLPSNTKIPAGFISRDPDNGVRLYQLMMDGTFSSSYLEESPTTIGIYNNKNLFITTHLSNKTCLWEIKNGVWTSTLLPVKNVYSIFWNPKEMSFVSTHRNEPTKLWKFVDGQWQPTILETKILSDICWSPSGKFFISIEDSMGYIWELVDGEYRSIKLGTEKFSNIHWSSNDNCFISVHPDRSIKIWQPEKDLLTFKQHMLIEALNLLKRQNVILNLEEHAHLYIILYSFEEDMRKELIAEYDIPELTLEQENYLKLDAINKEALKNPKYPAKVKYIDTNLKEVAHEEFTT